MAKKEKKIKDKDCGCDPDNKTHSTIEDYVARKTGKKELRK